MRRTVKAGAGERNDRIRMVVRRGAMHRFQSLKKKTAHLDVEVVWDQREGERRQATAAPTGERRRHERRRTPPFTWDMADFVVVTPKPAPSPAKKSRKPAAR
jgi:hypothetical protein